MEIRFQNDHDTGRPHCERHGVTIQEVREALSRRREDRPGREGSRIAIGATSAGRLLRVIYVPDWSKRGLFVVTSYPLTGAALNAYRRRRRRHGQ